ncbi:MAG TPA: hypothetical protein EYQ05_16450 [Gammaproteobacteria bacterium]|nr:hypothetical protein [Gammaproteobacteria bacterium]HIL98889.1 hypothetical protein [Pseudomonadales bacterium]
MKRADLRGADLTNALLTTADLTGANLTNSEGNVGCCSKHCCNTTMSNGAINNSDCPLSEMRSPVRLRGWHFRVNQSRRASLIVATRPAPCRCKPRAKTENARTGI